MKYLYILIISFSLLSCENNDDNTITDPGGFSKFYINNQSDSNLKLEFTLSDDYSNKQESEIIQSKGSKMIFEGGVIGLSPKPNEVFNEFKFYTTDPNTETLILTISPILNSDWTIIDNLNTPKNFDLFELRITNENLK
ncbi:hypothetical protein [Aestuariibaculum lutulentum]|uniref:Lipoprotein n=1 Tax=Aestuariibaculum lutulentum TaxID=2920935 RepID=A0ABS9RMG2_9FLAO|nr:hypothetical protein [Aestuariibaculum lutulentum]MCH4554131.1 hypothetical protein [Aestuariibaculum lutulentum]